MNKIRLQYLLNKYLSNTCSEVEMNELLSAFKQTDNESDIKLFLSEYSSNYSEYHITGEKSMIEDEEKWFEEIYTQAIAREKSITSKKSHTYISNQERSKSDRRYFTQWMKIAAILMISIFLSLFYYTMTFNNASQEIVNIIKAPNHGEKIQFMLPDGTEVHLNSGSRLEYSSNFDESNRKVHLEGEAFFNVARDEDRPFLVITEKITTQVLGTSFNIRFYPEDEQVTVAVESGIVALSEPEYSQNDLQVILEANQWARYTIESRSFYTDSGDVSSLITWKDGILLYHDKKLGDVAKMLERWYGVNISFTNGEMKDCVIRGEHRDESLVNVLNAITYAFDMEYQLDGKEVLLKGDTCN